MSNTRRSYGRSPRTGQLLTFITSYINEHNYAPTWREMAKELGASTSVVSNHLRYLEKTGHISLTHDQTPNGKSRTITLKGHTVRFTDEEWHLMHAAWGDDIKEAILEAAGQTRFVVTAPA